MPFVLSYGKEGGVGARRPPFFRTKKLALLGNTDSLAFAPFQDASWTLAAHPCCRPKCKREPDWYFDLHRPEVFTIEKKGWNAKYYQWLKRLQTPIFMQKNWPEIPMSVEYPLQRILSEFRAYFTNQCAFMIALAMTEGVTHIGLYGCQYAHETEHGVQRDSLTYWLGRFEQYGGTLVIPQKFNSLLCQPKGLYGYESHDETGKLLKPYQVTPTITKKTSTGKVERLALYPVGLNGECQVPLMTLPPDMHEPMRLVG